MILAVIISHEFSAANGPVMDNNLKIHRKSNYENAKSTPVKLF